eukprot:533599-Pleurochrysis_carterae.AAC.1
MGKVNAMYGLGVHSEGMFSTDHLSDTFFENIANHWELSPETCASGKHWKPHFQAAENVAVAHAALESSAQRPQITTLALEAGIIKKNPRQLCIVHQELCAFRDAVNLKTGKIFTLADSIQRHVADGKLHYYHLTQRQETIPSGKQKCNVLHVMKQKIWQDEQEAKLKVSSANKTRGAKAKVKAWENSTYPLRPWMSLSLTD